MYKVMDDVAKEHFEDGVVPIDFCVEVLEQEFPAA
jgi:hypothetical protein